MIFLFKLSLEISQDEWHHCFATISPKAILYCMYHRYRRSFLWAAYEGKSSNRHTDMILIPLTLGEKGFLCAQGSQLINSPLSEPEQANQCSAATKLWMTCALCSSRKAPLLTYFFFPRQTGKCGQRRRRNGAAWAAEAPPCFCPRRDSLWHRRHFLHGLDNTTACKRRIKQKDLPSEC